MKKLAQIFFGGLFFLLMLTVFCVHIPSAQERNKKSTKIMRMTIERMHTVLDVCERFKVDCGRYPTQIENLNALLVNPNASGWKGPYLKSVPLDYWGNPFFYFLDCNDRPIIISAGHDEIFNTLDDLSAGGEAWGQPPKAKVKFKGLEKCPKDEEWIPK